MSLQPLPKRIVPILTLAGVAAAGAVLLSVVGPPDGTVEVTQLLREERVQTGILLAARHEPDATPAPYRYTVVLDDGRTREFGYAAERAFEPGERVVVIDGGLAKATEAR